MTVGKRIKERREELGMSVDELADILSKNRATVYRYERDEIENLSITVLEPLAKALRTKPEILMGWDIEIDKLEIDEELSSKLLKRLTSYFYSLNEIGMEEALKRVEELTYIPLYCKNGDEK